MSLVNITTTGCELAELRPYPSVSSTDSTVDVTPIVGPDGKTTFDLGIVPIVVTQEPEYEYYNYWAEESGNLATNSWQWSWGNGDTGVIGLPVGDGVEVIAMGFHADNTAAVTDDMQVDLYDIQGNAQVFIARIDVINSGQGIEDNMYQYDNLRSSPVAVPDGAVLAFRSGTEVGNVNGARVGVWTRQETGRLLVTDVT